MYFVFFFFTKFLHNFLDISSKYSYDFTKFFQYFPSKFLLNRKLFIKFPANFPKYLEISNIFKISPTHYLQTCMKILCQVLLTNRKMALLVSFHPSVKPPQILPLWAITLSRFQKENNLEKLKKKLFSQNLLPWQSPGQCFSEPGSGKAALIQFQPFKKLTFYSDGLTDKNFFTKICCNGKFPASGS